MIGKAREAGSETGRAQSADQEGAPPPSRAAWVAAWAAVLALPVWIAQPSALALLLAAAGALFWTAGALRSRDRRAAAAAIALWLAAGTGAGMQVRLAQTERDWARVGAALEEQAAAELNTALDGLVERGEQAVAGVGELAQASAPLRPSAALFDRVAAVRRLTGVSAVALYEEDGEPVAWAGEHRGTVPPEVRRGDENYVFAEGPLFSYLYFVRPLPGGRVAVAAALLEANLGVGEEVPPFAESFARRHALTPRFFLPERARGESVWDWSTDRPILSVTFAELTPQDWWMRLVERGRWAVGLAWLAGFLLLSVVWYKRRMGAPGVPVAAATVGLLIMPIGTMLGVEEIFSPMQFLLPIPWPLDITLGTMLVLLTGTAVWLLTRSGADAGRRVPFWAQAGLALLVFAGGVTLVERSTHTGWLATRPGGGLVLQLVTTLLLGLPLYLVLRQGRRASRLPAIPLLIFGLLAPVALAILVVMLWQPDRELPGWTAAAWALPLAALALSLPAFPARRATLLAWLAAGWLAASAALPFLWTMHVGAELDNAERELARLGTVTNPYLNYLLEMFAEEAIMFARDGETGVNLLYHSWVASRLAREGFEARLTIWNGPEPEAELRLSDLQEIPEVVRTAVRSVAGGDEPVVQRYEQQEGVHYLLLVPLPDGRVISVAVPPRRRTDRATALARFLYPESEAEAAASDELLYLIPTSETGVDLHGAEQGGVKWMPIENGWRSEAQAHFPSGWMHAHLFVRTDSFGMLMVRGVLSTAGLLGILLLLWSVARLLCGELPAFPVVRREWMRSFRGRLTLALLVFFLVPTAFFGAVAYGAVAREVVFSAASLARRSLEQALPGLSAGATLAEASSQVGADFLLYRQGTLEGAAAPEVLGLGLFHTWLQPEIFLEFSTGEDVEEREERRLGQNEYLVAYRRIDAWHVLAAPIPLASHEISRRQRDFAHLALLVILLGAAFSVVLSLLVGRALTRPLDELSVAVARVGSGNLRIRLPERRTDEFGRVYLAFNRMVQRLHRARAALVRETRRTETIVAEAATGVLALDAERRVDLVNPRAAEILGPEALEVGRPLPRSGPLLSALADAVDDFWRSGATETGMEREIEGRIVRFRLRRLTAAQAPRGAVVALEDVTAEVRTARVLAWGEMARQVAHEIKNPLTPIKLSVQHLRRAHSDGRADFAQILERNVEAILQEIDRLGEIARAFSRFGTPQQQVEELEQVDVARAVEETLALYRSGGGGIRYVVDLAPGEPLPAMARMGELKEVLVNLLENAREALDGGGEIRVSAGPAPEPGWVEVVVADTGEGIPAELLPRIFEPHFSTRTSGTGLGLAIVRRMVDSWGGEVAAESEPGVGTRMRIRLRANRGG